MRRKSNLIFFAVLFVVMILSNVYAADVKRVNSYEEYVNSLEPGYKPVPKVVFDQAIKEGQLNIYDWAAWWDERIYQDFTKIFGIKIVRDNFANYDEMMAKYRLNPNLEYDVVLPDFRAFLQLKDLGLVSPLNHDWLPNVATFIRPSFRDIPIDPGYKHMLLYGMGFAGYIVNTNYVDGNNPLIGSWKYLFDAPRDLPKNGKLILRDNMYSVIGAALQYLGYSQNSDDEKELMAAKEVLLKLKPFIMAFDGWPQRPVLEQQTWVTGPHSVGDYINALNKVPGLRIVLPEEGTDIRSSCLTLPKGGPHKAAAHLWINYLFRTDRAVLHSLSAGQMSPNKDVHALLPEKAKAFVGFSASDAYIEKSELIEASAYTGQGLVLRTKIWEDLKK
jgi:spermidine/putrescine transport system substrate-binding protein